MSLARLSAVFRVELAHAFRRPLVLFLALVLLLSGFGLSTGKMQISSGDSSVGGMKAWITSEFAQTQMMTYIVLLYYACFLAAAAGLSLHRDRETKVDTLLHATPLRAGEYVWGRYLAVLAAFALLMLWQAFVNAFFNHAVPNGAAEEIRGPFLARSYLMPVATLGIPFLIFFAGLSMWVGERARSPVLVFVLPVATLLACAFFLWTWSPSWLDPGVNRALQILEPSGYRWLQESYLKVDRGVAFYNRQPVPYDAAFWLNRAWLVLFGLGAVILTQRSMARAMRGAVRPARAARPEDRASLLETSSDLDAALPDMTASAPSFFASAAAVARGEARELLRHGGLYIFVPMILLQCLGNSLVATGAFDTPVLLTPGTTAVGVAGQITVFLCLLLLYYMVESLERDRATGLAPILYATPVRTGALLLGKAAALSLVGAFVFLACLIACGIALAVQRTIPFSIVPYALVWGCLLLPTFLAWTAFVAAVYALTGNRLGAIALSLGALLFSGYRALTGGMSWAGNWPLWGVLRWSDLGFMEADRSALVWNRIMVLGLAVLFGALAVRLFGRTTADAVRTVHRLRPREWGRQGRALLPYAAVPAVACAVLLFQVSQGPQGGAAKKARKDYWTRNLKTWLDAPLPDIARADVRLRLDPRTRAIASEGTFTLVNPTDSVIARIPITGGAHWRRLRWTLDGRAYEPEDGGGLYVFTPPRPLARGDRVAIGWSWEGRFPEGISRNGGNLDEFVLPSGVVLTGFTPSFVPVLGFMEDLGETKDNRTEPRRYPRDYWKGITRGGYGATAWFPARVTITAPEAYTSNSVGVCVRDTVQGGWRTQVWETDHPVKILNVVCGRWEVERGRGTAIYYHPRHRANVEEMSSTLDAARRWYSEWFLPYPWRELKLSEFPGLAGYAQGFGTNITFSENIGFLTKNDARTDATFLVTAHEAAHQWWGNILTPANGPGAELLSEAMSHFATMLLFEQVRGSRGRMGFAEGIEARYGDRRRVDEERPLYDVDGKRGSDETVIYDRGGWVFWMLHDFLGRERALAGTRAFIRTWSGSRDHPALQDYVASLRAWAPDTAAFDAFVKQWMEDRVMPEYRIRSARREKRGSEHAVTVTVQNIGTGRMPVEVAAVKGKRWRKGAPTGPPASAPDPSYRESRSLVTLGSGESRTVVIRCPFEPERVVIDPDVRILQLRRKQAVASL